MSTRETPTTLAPREIRANRRGWPIASAVALSLMLVAASASPVSAQHARVRFGISGVGGGFVGAAHGALGGAELRIGVQINRVVAVYLQAQGLLGRFLPSPGDGLAGFAFHSLMVDFTIEDFFQIGFGPALDFTWGCDARYQLACSGTGPYLGGDFRLAFVTGEHHAGRRSGFTFSFDVHPTWFGNDAAITLLAGLGYEMY